MGIEEGGSNKERSDEISKLMRERAATNQEPTPARKTSLFTPRVEAMPGVIPAIQPGTSVFGRLRVWAGRILGGR